MATQMVTQTGGSSLFSSTGNFGIALDGGVYDLHELSKSDLAAPHLVMLANVALTGEISSNCSEYAMEEERQMADLTTVNDDSFSDSDGEKMEELHSMESNLGDFESMDTETPQSEKYDEGEKPVAALSSKISEPDPMAAAKTSSTENKNKCTKSKPFRCKPCQYKAESEEEFVHHIKIHSAKKFIDNDTKKKSDVKEPDSCIPEETDFSKGPIRCDRCGYNTNRFDHYLAHLRHHNKVGENERVYKCSICTYTTVSEYHWKKHLRNHFPRKVYTCSQCSYFSDRKNNYIQHIRTHTGERPYQCIMCPYSSSQKTHLTRHMRTHSGEKPFKCEQCSYVASNQHEVTRHARQVHNGPKPLTCPHCEYKTADRSNFKKHVELHVNPRQFLCPVCDYAASKKCNLQYHIKSRHSGCTDITMDVSKVKLRTKKEVGVKGFATKKQTEKGNLKINGETDKKIPDKIIKVEKKSNCVKDKKNVSVSFNGQTKTRSFRTSTRNRYKLETDKNFEIYSKGKCAKRKAVAASEKFNINDKQTRKAKKIKLVQKSKRSKLVLKRNIKRKLSQKQKICIKKRREIKHFKNRFKKKTSKQSNTKKRQSKRIKDKNVEKEPTCSVQSTLDNSPQIPEAEQIVSEVSPTQPDVAAENLNIEKLEHVDSPAKENLLDNLSTCFNEVDNTPPSLAVDENPDDLLTENSMDLAELETEHSLNPVVESTRDLPLIKKPKNISDTCGLDESTEPIQPEDRSIDEFQELHELPREPDSISKPAEQNTENPCTLEICEEQEDTTREEKNIEPEIDLPGSSTPNINNPDPKNTQTSKSSFNDSNCETVDIEEDEGIHSHDGSDISDNISERSDDSGLNGTPSITETVEPKPSLSSTEANISKETFVCIFCDRAFRKEGEYTKHLKRHLVNVYYLEKAAKDES